MQDKFTRQAANALKLAKTTAQSCNCLLYTSNCVADVNIPVGEVFTSPVLAGTGGILHVKKVYLNGLQFKDLKLVFDCGQVIDYSCANFETEEENRAYIEDNILHHQPRCV